jgi:hypothetical protein
MSETLADFEQDFAKALQAYADAAVAPTPPEHVLADILRRKASRRRSWLQLAAFSAVVVVVAGVVGIWALTPTGSQIPKATVADIQYDVAVARSLVVQQSDLTRYGAVVSADFGWAFSESVAYELRGVDPDAALVVPARPGASDDAGSWGDYLLLWGPSDPFPEICRYFSDAPGTPDECKAKGVEGGGWAVARPPTVAGSGWLLEVP